MSWRPPLGDLTGALIVFNAATQLWERGSAGSVILAGDVDGPADNNVVNSIQGVPVDMTGAAPGDMLIIDGAGNIVPSATPPAGVTLAAVLVNGNVTGGRNIEITNGDVIAGEQTAAGIAGGDVTVQGGESVDGRGGDVAITGADAHGAAAQRGGSVIVAGGEPTSGGVSGFVAIVGGPGVGNTAGGTVTIDAGIGGPAGGSGGFLALRGGASLAAGAAGGNVSLLGGIPTDGPGGSITLNASNAVGTNRAGGAAGLRSGDSTGNAAAGALTITGGTGGATGTAGAVTITAGQGGTTSGNGASATVQGGAPGPEGNGGGVFITGRNAATATATNRSGGGVFLQAGTSVAASNGGPISIVGGNANTGLGGDVTVTPGTSTTNAHGILAVGGMWGTNARISPAQMNAAENDYNPTGNNGANVFRLTPAAGGTSLSGIVRQRFQGRRLLIVNIGADTLTLVHDATSTAQNRFLCPNSVDLAIPPNGARELWYDQDSVRWRVVGAVA